MLPLQGHSSNEPTPHPAPAHQCPPHPPSAAETVRDTPGEVRRRAAETEAQCTAASYAPDPCSVSSDPLSTAAEVAGWEWGGQGERPMSRGCTDSHTINR